MISHVDTVIAYVGDQPKIVGFFVGALGFEKRTDAEMRPGQRWMEVAPPGAQTTLAILEAADFSGRLTRHTRLRSPRPTWSKRGTRYGRPGWS